MFKSTNDFKTAMFEILQAIQNGFKYPFNLETKYSEEDFLKALESCIDTKLISGLRIKWSGDGIPTVVFVNRKTELTYAGLEFLESFQND